MEHTGASIEKRKWYKNTMAIIGLIGALAGGVYGVIQILYSPAFKTNKVEENIEIVLDRSLAMKDKFDGTTKWVAAVSATKKSLAEDVAQKDNLALRQFGGICDDPENTKLLVEFDQNNEGVVRNALNKMGLESLKGDTTLVSAVVEATGDFNNPDRFAGVNKKIIVITGGADQCPGDPVRAIHNRLRSRIGTGKNIELSFRFIGMGLQPDQQEQLRKIAEKTGGDAAFPKNKQELDRAYQRAYQEEAKRGPEDGRSPPAEELLSGVWEDPKLPCGDKGNICLRVEQKGHQLRIEVFDHYWGEWDPALHGIERVNEIWTGVRRGNVIPVERRLPDGSGWHYWNDLVCETVPGELHITEKGTLKFRHPEEPTCYPAPVAVEKWNSYAYEWARTTTP